MDILFNRRSVRTFTDQAVEDSKLEKILRAAMQAPSAGNQRPWEFVVYRKRERLDQLSSIHPYTKPIAQAPLAILLLSRKNNLKYPSFWQQDMGACAQNLMLEAVHLNLGTLWMGLDQDKEEILTSVHEIFNISNDYHPFGIIALGYPAKDNANHFVDRYEPHRVHFEEFTPKSSDSAE